MREGQEDLKKAAGRTRLPENYDNFFFAKAWIASEMNRGS
jgi:hypothetical protein